MSIEQLTRDAERELLLFLAQNTHKYQNITVLSYNEQYYGDHWQVSFTVPIKGKSLTTITAAYERRHRRPYDSGPFGHLTFNMTNDQGEYATGRIPDTIFSLSEHTPGYEIRQSLEPHVYKKSKSDEKDKESTEQAKTQAQLSNLGL